jgi:stage II sporulation protein M
MYSTKKSISPVHWANFHNHAIFICPLQYDTISTYNNRGGFYMRNDVLDTIKENRSWLLLSFIFFVVGAILSYVSLTREPELYAMLEETSLSLLRELGEMVFGGHPLRGAALLFMHNLISSLQVLFLGILLGLAPLFSTLANGAILGAVAFQLGQQGIAPIPFLLVGILPHGIFELPAFFISAAFGFKLGYHVLFPVEGHSRKHSLVGILQEIGRVLPVIFILLLLAALIEVFITPGIMLYFLEI